MIQNTHTHSQSVMKQAHRTNVDHMTTPPSSTNSSIPASGFVASGCGCAMTMTRNTQHTTTRSNKRKETGESGTAEQ
jgi:hypothetical protein